MAHAASGGRHEYEYGMSMWRASLIALAISAVVNAAIFLIGRAADLIPASVEVQSPAGEGRLTIAAVLLMSIVPVIAAALLYLLRRRWTDRPARAFGIVGSVLLVLSLAMPFGVPDVPMKMALTLGLMHVVTGLAILVLIPQADDRRTSFSGGPTSLSFPAQRGMTSEPR